MAVIVTCATYTPQPALQLQSKASDRGGSNKGAASGRVAAANAAANAAAGRPPAGLAVAAAVAAAADLDALLEQLLAATVTAPLPALLRAASLPAARRHALEELEAHYLPRLLAAAAARQPRLVLPLVHRAQDLLWERPAPSRLTLEEVARVVLLQVGGPVAG